MSALNKNCAACQPNANCTYTLKPRKTPSSSWNKCINYRQRRGLLPCPKPILPSNNVCANSSSNQSKKMRDAARVKVNGRGWRKVNWRRFQLMQQTKQLRNHPLIFHIIPTTLLL